MRFTVTQLCALALTFIFHVKFVWWHQSHCSWGPGPHINRLLLDAADIFERNGLDFWLDYGTLLRVTQNKKLSPYDFKNAVSMMDFECQKLFTAEVRVQFLMAGYVIYNRTDYIHAKVAIDINGYTLFWASPYLDAQCVRIYDFSHAQYLNVYSFEVINAPSGTALGSQNLLRRTSSSLHTNSKFKCGSCTHDLRDVYPLATVSILGGEFPVPQNATEVSRNNYPDAEKAVGPMVCVETWSSWHLFLGILAYGCMLWLLFSLVTNRVALRTPFWLQKTKQMSPLHSWYKCSIFCSYIGLWVMQGMLIYSSRDPATDQVPYNFTAVVMLTEVMKLTISTMLYLNTMRNAGPAHSLALDFRRNSSFVGLYLLPAALYCVHNNLTFVALSMFDPPAYFILMQFRLVVTALVYRAMFKKKFSKHQGTALLFVACGCGLKEMPKLVLFSQAQVPILGWGIIVLQIICATFAGMYVESLLKRKTKNISIHLQNIFMYINSIACNLLVLASGIGGHSLSSLISLSGISEVLSFHNMLIICNGAFIGLATAFFLKQFSSALKSIACAIEIVVIAIVSFYLFGTELGPSTVLAVVTVAAGIYIYSTNPLPAAVSKPQRYIKQTL